MVKASRAAHEIYIRQDLDNKESERMWTRETREGESRSVRERRKEREEREREKQKAGESTDVSVCVSRYGLETEE